MSLQPITGYFFISDISQCFSEMTFKRTKPLEIIEVLQRSFDKDYSSASTEFKENLQKTLQFAQADRRNDLVKIAESIPQPGHSKPFYANDIVVASSSRSLIGFPCVCADVRICEHWMDAYRINGASPSNLLLFRPHPKGMESLTINSQTFNLPVMNIIFCPANMTVRNFLIFESNKELPYLLQRPRNIQPYPFQYQYQELASLQYKQLMQQQQQLQLQQRAYSPVYEDTQQYTQQKQTKEEDEGMVELGEADYGEIPQPNAYSNYVPKQVHVGVLHPDPIIESYSLSQVDPPPITVELELLRKKPKIISDGLLSNLQIESIFYATQAHEQTIHGKYTRGFFVGDGAGVGKGRQVSGIIAEQLLRGNRRHVWFSVTNDLLYDSIRDLRDINFGDVDVYPLAKAKYGKLEKENHYGDGILYCTYSSLVATKQSKRQNINESRFSQIVHWCGGDKFQGVIVFDECHRAKNLSLNQRGMSSKTAETVENLQKKLPHAKVVYCSATGVSELRNLCYMSRLGLWGPKTPFTDFPTFLKTVEQRGMGALELFAMELKHMGLYVSRQLSYEGATFESVIAGTKELREIYDNSVQFWRKLRHEFLEAYTIASSYSHDEKRDSEDDDDLFFPDEFEGESSVKLNRVWCYFWGCCQRFFRFMCIALKVPTVIATAEEAIKNGKSVVIGLQSTGEARTKAAIGDQTTVSEFISAPQGILRELISKAFPLPPTPESVKEERLQKILAERKVSSRKSKHIRPQLLSYVEIDSDDDLEVDDNYIASDDSSNESLISDDELKQIICYMCNRDENDSELLICDKCAKRGCHTYCCDPPMDEIPDVEWFCEKCLNPVEIDEAELERRKQAEKEEHERRKQEEKEERRRKDEELTNVYNTLMKKKNQLLELVDAMKLPPNPLDELIDKLGGCKKVAEMTGRAIHLVRQSTIGENGELIEKICVEKRNTDLRLGSDKDCTLDEVNLAEKDLFLSGKKLIAIISEAASSGISLQADKRVLNQRRRVHITIELPWTAEKAIQQLGRTHRSNQSSAPEYKFVLTDIGGEKRFAAAVGNRLKVLGAITQGDRLANNAFQLDAFTLDYSLGNEALKELLRIVQLGNLAGRDDVPIPIRISEDSFLPDRAYGSTINQIKSWLTDITLFTSEGRATLFGQSKRKTFVKTDAMDKFLNRLLCLEVEKQNIIVTFFTDLLEYLTEEKKKKGTFDDGISDITGKNITLKEKTEIFEEKTTNSITYHYHFEINTGMNYEEVAALKENNKDGAFYRSKISWFGVDHYVYAEPYNDQKCDEIQLLRQKFHLKGNLYKAYRYNNGLAAKPMSKQELDDKYEIITTSAAEKFWRTNYERSGEKCLHNGNCPAGDRCQKGKRVRSIHILSGSILPIWETVAKQLEAMGSRGQNKLSKADQRLKIVRVSTKENEKVFGLRVSPNAIQEILQTLKEKQERIEAGEGDVASILGNNEPAKPKKAVIDDDDESDKTTSDEDETPRSVEIRPKQARLPFTKIPKSASPDSVSDDSPKPKPSLIKTKTLGKNAKVIKSIVNLSDDPSTDESAEERNIESLKEETIDKENVKPEETKAQSEEEEDLSDASHKRKISDAKNLEIKKIKSEEYKDCPSCQNSNRTLAKFCDNCGYKLL